jgi:hypothetical protein
MDASYYIENNPFKKPPRSNTHLKYSIGGLLFLGVFLFWSNRHGARSLRQEASERQEAVLPRLRPLKAAPIEPSFGDDKMAAAAGAQQRSGVSVLSNATSRTPAARESEHTVQQNQTRSGAPEGAPS